MTRAARRDGNEAGIIAALEKAGASVQQLNLTNGPDLLVGANGLTHLLEIKSERGQLSAGQSEWHRNWRGEKVWVVREPAVALIVCGLQCGRK
jgi:hypothetical protein